MAIDRAGAVATSGAEAEAERARSVRGRLIRQLVEDVQRLTAYAIEKGDLPNKVEIETLYTASRQLEEQQELSPGMCAELVSYYEVLQRRLEGVTPRSLVATEPEKPGKIRTSPAGRYLTKLWVWTGLVVAVILTANLIQYWNAVTLPPPGDALSGAQRTIDLMDRALQFLEPFLYGALGAFVYILRVSERRLPTREFDTARWPEHFNRLVLGALAGGSIILFISQVPGTNGTDIQISSAALGFLAGYSIDFLFQTLDRIIHAILPKVGLDTVENRTRRRQDDERIRRYQTMLDEAEDEEIKKLLRQFIDDLHGR